MTKPCCVLFDAVGTLIFPHPPVAAAYGQAAASFGSPLSASQIDERFRHAFRRQEILDAGPLGWRTDEARELRRWQDIVAEVFDEVSDPSALFNELWWHFCQPAHWRLFDDVADTWKRLASGGFTLGIASNFDRRLRQVCGGLPPLDHSPHVFVSSELGVRKPSPDFFRLVEKTLQLRPSQILLVGDDVTNDFLAAQSAGWRAILLDRSGERRGAPGTIETLHELVSLLQSADAPP
jgi:putative hydrolase of the HAD superfamily